MDEGINKIYLSLLISFFLNINFYAQEKADDYSFSIKFHHSIHSRADIFEPNFFDKIVQLILGDENSFLSKPISICAEDSNSIFVLDQGLGDLIRINKFEKSMVRINSKFSYPSLVDVCSYKNGHYIFTDSKNNTLYLLNSNTNEVEIFKNSIQIDRPTGICYLSSKQEIWVSETNNHSIVVLTEAGELKKRIGKRGVENSEFNYPTKIWFDGKKIYIVDAMNFRIQIFDLDGQFLYSFGIHGDATGYMARPKGLATDTYGNIYIVDALFHSIQVFNSYGEFLYNFGSQGTSEGNFWLPNGIYIDKNNFIYVADSYNSRIQIFKLLKLL